MCDRSEREPKLTVGTTRQYLRQLNNFHSLFAVLAGLNLPPVQSLNRAFSEIPLQTQSVRHDNLRSSLSLRFRFSQQRRPSGLLGFGQAHTPARRRGSGLQGEPPEVRR